MNGHTIAWGFVFIVILAAAGVWAWLWCQITKLRWTRFQVEKVEVVSTGYLCFIKHHYGRISLGGKLEPDPVDSYFFDRADIKIIEYQLGQGLRRTLVIKKAALRRRGLS